MPTAPNAANLTRHAGVASFKKDGDDAFVDLGFTETFKLNLSEDTTFDYKSRRNGSRATAKSFPDEKKMSINFSVMDVVGFNLALALGGTPTTQSDGTKLIRITKASTRGTLKFVGDVEDGNPMTGTWTVDIRSAGELDLLPDQLVEISLIADVVSEDSDGAFGQIVVDDGGATF